MAAVLLTGAGFSRNWGGRLAKEVNTAIALRVQSDQHLADLLHRNPNFEEALTELQNKVATPRVRAHQNVYKSSKTRSSRCSMT